MTVGHLYVCATPIGNLGDKTIRLSETLANVAIIACEDTRITGRLFKESTKRPRLKAHHKFNEKQTLDYFLKLLRQGHDVAVVTDAGTPGIADPGFLLVAAAHANDIPVIPIPGPSAVSTACSVSGFDCSRYHFTGFLPRKEKELGNLMERHSTFEIPLVFFESPNRIQKSVERLKNLLSLDTQLCLCRETTKHYETILHGTLAVCQEKISDHTHRGEWTGVLEKVNLKKQPVDQDLPSIEAVSQFFNTNRSQSAKVLKLISGKSRKAIYQKTD